MISIAKIKKLSQTKISIHEIAKELGCQISDLKPIIEHWENKGKIIRVKSKKCANCSLACSYKIIWQST